jgi:glycosyltransferase involved in cell wall biosynthesis
VDLYIALSEFSRRKFVEGGLPVDHITVKANFVHPDPGPGRGERAGYLFAGRLVEEKGVRTLLRAWDDDGISAPLRIAGDGPLAKEVTEAAKRNRAIDYLGPIDHPSVMRAMQDASALVFPSLWYEGFPLAIIEAFACGLPVIASDIGGARETIDDSAGRLFRAGDTRSLIDAITLHESSPSNVPAMSEACRRIYESKYTADANVMQLVQLYEQAIRNAGTGP